MQITLPIATNLFSRPFYDRAPLNDSQNLYRIDLTFFHTIKSMLYKMYIRAILGKLLEDFFRRCRVKERPFDRSHRVAGGSHPPPAPTERRMQISRTALFRG